MRFSTIALAASAARSATAAMTICDKYTVALLKDNTGANQYTLLTLLVNTAVIGNYTGKGSANPTLPGSLNAVPGILASGMYMGEKVNLLPYFSGGLVSTNVNGKASSVNFLDGGGATPIIKDPTSSGAKGSNQYFLLTHLYQFFGILLGCSEYGMSGFPSYQGDPNMASVHQYMDLDAAEFGYFVEQVGLAATSFGVTSSDAMAAGTALNEGFGMRCAPPATVVPGAGALPQAICIADDCPEASNPDCSAYINAVPPMSAVSTPAPTGGSGGGSGGSPPMPTVTSVTGAAATLKPVAGALAAAGIAAAFL